MKNLQFTVKVESFSLQQAVHIFETLKKDNFINKNDENITLYPLYKRRSEDDYRMFFYSNTETKHPFIIKRCLC